MFNTDVEVAICSIFMLTDSRAGDEWTNRYVRYDGEFFGVDLTRGGGGGVSSAAIERGNIGDFTYSTHGANTTRQDDGMSQEWREGGERWRKRDFNSK